MEEEGHVLVGLEGVEYVEGEREAGGVFVDLLERFFGEKEGGEPMGDARRETRSFAGLDSG